MPLTRDQRSALWDIAGHPMRGLRVLSARPGTGKTTTLTDYCIDIVIRWRNTHQPWQGMAVVSYTNVAKDELEVKIRRLGQANMLLKPPHFVGTLDAFVNQQLFLPYGAQIMQCAAGRPVLVGEPYQQWNSPWGLHNTRPAGAYATRFFDCYSVGLDGTPFVIDSTPREVRVGVKAPAKQVTASNAPNILSMKKHVWRQGMALQSDATYIAYQALCASPALTRALAGRFPVLVVDEAQDMTEIQHALVDHLVAAGHQHVILVGDENQAIYEWNTARPQLFIAKSASTTWQSKALTESFRCSPAICAALTAMADDGIVLKSAPGAKNSTYNDPVEIRSYDPGHDIEVVHKAITSVTQALSGRSPHTGNPAGLKSVAVLARSAKDARQLQAEFNGVTINAAERTVWNSTLTRDYLKVIHLLKRGDVYTAAGSYEALLRRAGNHGSIADMRTAHMAKRGIVATDTIGYRVALLRDLRQIASAIPTAAELKISDCGRCCAASLGLVDSFQLAAIRQDCDGFASSVKKDQDRLLSTLFADRDARTWLSHPNCPDVQLIFSTAHGVKGETYDGVVFYTKKRVLQCGCPHSAAAWRNILTHSVVDCETKRIAYVALSRAAQMLVIIAPADDINQWQAYTTQDDDR
jgi:superfamily I DNA/RNA helicase